jgi:hypothetical protein
MSLRRRLFPFGTVAALSAVMEHGIPGSATALPVRRSVNASNGFIGQSVLAAADDLQAAEGLLGLLTLCS